MSKEQIIKEIQRTAKANGGVPLGKMRFAKETGIKESDWSGKYWAKWSDAIIEAGYEPNVLQGSYDDQHLLDLFANYVQEIGHIPTVAELRLKARNTSDFPSHNTFARLGAKKILLGRLLQFCKKNERYRNLVELIESSPHTIPTEEQDISESKNTKESTGYVYLMQFGNEYKIGNSNNVEKRFRQLRTQMPYEGKIIHTIETGDPEGIETYWHQYFDDKRLKGEWFKLTADDVKYFKRRKLM